FFFSRRRLHTIFSRDWSSDVCSSDLDFVLSKANGEFFFSFSGGPILTTARTQTKTQMKRLPKAAPKAAKDVEPKPPFAQKKLKRSEERRVGKKGNGNDSTLHRNKQ